MEKLEYPNRPEITEQKLRELIDKLDVLHFSDFETFTFDGHLFSLQILPSSHLKRKHGGAWFAHSTHIEGTDIYIVKNQPPAERKKRIFHEVLEAHAVMMGFDGEIAHQYASEQERILFI